MGAVFRAVHLGTERPVALKIIAPNLMQNVEVLERFKREARAAGRLQHPNVVNVTDFGVAQCDGAGVAYLAMEFLEGFTLGELLRRQQKLSLQIAIDVLEQVAIAVDQAHRLGIVHRDLKPDNIWLAPDGRGGYQVKVLDFGVAAFRESAVTNAPEKESATIPLTGMTTSVLPPHLTHTGTVIGTPAYMSPEQCSGASVTSKSDIYSLGVIAYQMVTGDLPFNGNTFELIAKHVAAAPPDPASVAKPVAATILSALAKNPEERPVSASAFAGALRALSEKPSMVVRRALSVFSLWYSDFMRLSIITLAPAAIAFALGVVLAAVGIARESVPLAIILPLIPLLLLNAGGNNMLGALVFLWMEQWRRFPMQPPDTASTLAKVGECLPGAPKVTARNAAWYGFKLARLSQRATLRSLRSDTQLRFLSLVASGGDVDKAVEEARKLTEVLGPSRLKTHRILDIFVLPMIVATVAFWAAVIPAAPFLLPKLNLAARSMLELVAAGMLISIGGLLAWQLFVGPVLWVAYTILYYRARQASGEDVPFSVAARL